VKSVDLKNARERNPFPDGTLKQEKGLIFTPTMSDLGLVDQVDFHRILLEIQR